MQSIDLMPNLCYTTGTISCRKQKIKQSVPATCDC